MMPDNGPRLPVSSRANKGAVVNLVISQEVGNRVESANAARWRIRRKRVRIQTKKKKNKMSKKRKKRHWDVSSSSGDE